jgi:hypothetical protein
MGCQTALHELVLEVKFWLVQNATKNFNGFMQGNP